MQNLLTYLRQTFSDDGFYELMHDLQAMISKFLSLLMLVVIGVTVFDLIKYLIRSLVTIEPYGSFGDTLLEVFGLFLNVLIALELLDNLTAYLHRNVANQVKLVIVTATIAVARKLIILDLEKTAGLNLVALGVAVLALAISYWLIHNASDHNEQE